MLDPGENTRSVSGCRFFILVQAFRKSPPEQEAVDSNPAGPFIVTLTPAGFRARGARCFGTALPAL
jgi:hypothetical protein